DINSLFDWISAQQDLDAGRICVTGGSYGGDMTLAISTFYSDRIKCSVDIVGMSNLVTFLEHTEAYRRDLRRVEYGDERDSKMHDFLEKIAPMNNIDKIKKPMLVVAGRNDPRVPVTESEQIVGALKKQGTPVWYLMAKDEGHGFRKKQNQDFQFYTTIEFLEEYLLKQQTPLRCASFSRAYRLQRNVSVLFARVSVALIFEGAQRGNDSRPCVGGLDDRV